MQRRHLFLAVAAGLVVYTAGTILYYGRLHTSATVSGPPTVLANLWFRTSHGP